MRWFCRWLTTSGYGLGISERFLTFGMRSPPKARQTDSPTNGSPDREAALPQVRPVRLARQARRAPPPSGAAGRDRRDRTDDSGVARPEGRQVPRGRRQRARRRTRDGRRRSSGTPPVPRNRDSDAGDIHRPPRLTCRIASRNAHPSLTGQLRIFLNSSRFAFSESSGGTPSLSYSMMYHSMPP